MTRLVSALLLVLALGIGQKAEAAIVVATFADPAVGSDTGDPSLFTFTALGGVGLTGSTISQSTEGLTADVSLEYLNALGGVLANFTFPTLTWTGLSSGFSGQLYDANGGTGLVGDAGDVTSTIDFFDSGSNALLMSISFNYAILTQTAVGAATSGVILNVVDITIPGWNLTAPETFAFAFSNQVTDDELATLLADGGSRDINASFTASAATAERDVPVPEPGSMLLLGTGLMGLAASARRRFSRRNK